MMVSINRVTTPNSERFFSTELYHSDTKVVLKTFPSDTLHSRCLLLKCGAERSRKVMFLGRFAPFFLQLKVFRIKSGGNNSEHFTGFKKNETRLQNFILQPPCNS